MNPFELVTPERLCFGSGSLARLKEAAPWLGSRTLVVTGASGRFLDRVSPLLKTAGIDPYPVALSGEPTLPTIASACEKLRRDGAQSVIAVGGGSAVDAGKAIAALAVNPGDPLDYLEVIGQGKPLSVDPLPFVAIPTTAGTGAECTKNAVLASPEQRVKVSLRSPKMLPRLAIIDPDLTAGLPLEATGNAGLDALTQVIEPFLTRKANPLTDALCQPAIPAALGALETLAQGNEDPKARETMAYTAMVSGLALANAGLGVVHGFAGPIGGMFPAPHGAICARLLPDALRTNAAAIAQASDAALDRRIQTLTQLLAPAPDATLEDGIRRIEALAAQFGIRGLASYGIGPADLPEIVSKAQRASSMKGNPVTLSSDALTDLLACNL